VRRIATVIISAPLASVHALVSARSTYLPEPTSKRELYVLPAIVRRLSLMIYLDGCLQWAI